MERSALLPALAGALLLFGGGAALSAPVLTEQQVRAVQGQAIDRGAFFVPINAVAIAWIESSFRPSVSREESGGRRSVGLMQTLVSTAQWLARDRGYGAMGVPTFSSLKRPEVSAYFGLAYIDYLARYRSQRHSEEWIVRSYNGGPGHSTGATNGYWSKYRAAKERFS